MSSPLNLVVRRGEHAAQTKQGRIMSVLIAELVTESKQLLQVRQGDLTQEDVDAIVNAANSHLAHGGGLAAAIVQQGGYVIQEESDRWLRENGEVPEGQVVLTRAGRLPCKYIIHAVGPVWHGGRKGEDETLRQATWNSLMKAHELSLTAIALPAISSGIFKFPKDRCATILVRTALDFCRDHPESPLRQIRFTNLALYTVSLFEVELQKSL